jgi:hypothetical protein
MTAPVVSVPGVVLDMPADQYHLDPVEGGSLSSTGARKLLPPSTPAAFRYWQTHPDEDAPTKAMTAGTVAHCLVLGAGPCVAVLDYDNWRTNAAKQAAAEATERGEIPMLRKDYEPILAMAEALLQHKTAAKLFEGAQAEASLFWQDDQTGVWRRARFDLLRQPQASGRLLIPDYKTGQSANPATFAKSAANLGYHQQGAYYEDAARALELSDDPVFLYIVQETTAPYLVSVVQLEPLDMRIGARLNRQAIDLYAQCKQRDEWPGYGDEIAHVSLPAWYTREFLDF